jgi:putative SOS response-associated peptidase YedK
MVTSGKKIPYRVELKGRKPFANAGLCSRWKDEAGKDIDTFTIITTNANEIVGTIHNRMPVIFNPEQETKWLDPLIGPEEIDQYLIAYSEIDMQIYPISTLVNNPRNDSAEIVTPMSSK